MGATVLETANVESTMPARPPELCIRIVQRIEREIVFVKHKKFFSKRGLAMFVSLVLCVNALSLTAWAGSFSDLQALIDNNETVILGEDYSYSAEKDENTTININQNVNLNLNGWTITGSSNNSVITIGQNGNLTLRDEQGEAPTATSTATSSAPVNTGDGAGSTEKTGTITGGTNNAFGGGIYVNGGSLTMQGGAITGNTAQNGGGGVYVTNGGNFTMDGGSIAENETNKNNGAGVYGGGGVLIQSGTFTMNGGAITENKAGGSGAGVYVNTNAAFTMTGGEISKNTSTAGEGGGVYVMGTFNMEGGEITGNTSNKPQGGGGVRVWNGKFTMNGGSITGNKANNAKNDLQSIAANPDNAAVVNAGTIGEDAERFISSDACTRITEGGIITVPAHNWSDATCKAPATCTVCKKEAGNVDSNNHTVETIPEQLATCTAPGWTAGTKCSECGIFLEKPEETELLSHQETPDDVKNTSATCTKAGWEGATKCSDCGKPLNVGTEIPSTSHHFGNWSDWVVNEAEGTQTRTRMCTDCKYEEKESAPVPPEEGGNTTDPVAPGEEDETDPPVDPAPGESEDPITPADPVIPDGGDDIPAAPDGGVTIIPDDDIPLAGTPATAAAGEDTTIITEEEIPLAGLTAICQLLDELYRYEESPAAELPEEFPFAEHDYAQAICWSLDSALVFDTEEEPFDPDELLTAGILREVLSRFAARKGIEELEFTVDGEDEDLIMDLGDQLSTFYTLLEEALADTAA